MADNSHRSSEFCSEGNILRLSDDPDVNNVIRYLREREIVHYQRFGEGLRRALEKMDEKNFYVVNPAFDR